MYVYPVCARQMPQRHATGFLDDLDHGLIVFSNDEARGLFWPPGIRKVFSSVEDLGVRVHLALLRPDLWLFSFLWLRT